MILELYEGESYALTITLDCKREHLKSLGYKHLEIFFGPRFEDTSDSSLVLVYTQTL